MNKLFTLFLTIVLLVSSCKEEGISYKLYYLGGQSNMDGYGYVSELPAEFSGIYDDILIFHGNIIRDDSVKESKGIWTGLRAGHGAGFKSDGITNNYGERFGCELSFGLMMKELRPDENIAILKYSMGGTSIDTEAAGRAGC